tara:strand:+ start:889 stop:1104 length:216 start_codon:yes stop_codon:yes gene_type:complete
MIYTQQTINTLNDSQKVELFEKFQPQLWEQMSEFGFESLEPTFEDDSCEISNDFKLLYINESFVEDFNQLN